MSAAVLISTHRLERAGPLRSAFDDAGYPVELVTPDEPLARQTEARLLIVTGGVEDAEARPLVEAAHRTLHVPVFGVIDGAHPEARAAAARLGLAETFVHPADPDVVLLLGRTAIERRRLQEITGIVGDTDGIREALERVVQIAPVPSTVLVTGESGTGKELVARGIHALSPRKHERFIAVNLAALPETLLESELFGHEKGAFTGAIDARRGFFELAHRGTIFLDEIGEMPLTTQTKLLRVLEQREFIRVGGESPITIDVRIVAATNRDLRQQVAAGAFRRDLYYRLNVLSIELPPLRDRKEDVPLLVHAFIGEFSETLDRPFKGISPEAMEILQAYKWPGNVRELRNLIESMVVLAPGREIRPEDIPDPVRYRTSERTLLPAVRGDEAAGHAAGRAVVESASLRPELEFVFRTLVELRVDMDDLRREFEVYRERDGLGPLRSFPAPGRSGVELGGPGRSEAGPYVGGIPSDLRIHEASEAAPDDPASMKGGTVVVYEPGMTMEDLERLAIEAALEHTGGNRRRAAEELGIGERTLYRKIQRYGIDA